MTNKLTIWILAISCFLTPIAFGESKGTASSEKPMTRVEKARHARGDHYANRLELFIEAAPDVKPGGIIMLGDSITEGFSNDLYFPGEPYINRGIGGDKIRGVLERLDVSVEKLKPSKVYLLIGINEFVWYDGEPPETMETDYHDLFSELNQVAPQAEIVVVSLLPVGERFQYASDDIVAVNKRLATLAEEYGFEYMDLHTPMVDENGQIKDFYTVDGVHLSLAGYLSWLETMLPPEKFAEVGARLVPLAEKALSNERQPDKIDPTGDHKFPGSRGTDELVVYTPEYERETTGTNQWGVEAVVKDNIITEVNGNNRAIPENGFVVSGHGISAEWIRLNLKKGLKIKLSEDGVLMAEEVEEQSLSTFDHLEMIRDDLLYVLNKLDGKKEHESKTKQAKEVLFEILVLREERAELPSKDLETLSDKRDELLAFVKELD